MWPPAKSLFAGLDEDLLELVKANATVVVNIVQFENFIYHFLVFINTKALESILKTFFSDTIFLRVFIVIVNGPKTLICEHILRLYGRCKELVIIDFTLIQRIGSLKNLADLVCGQAQLLETLCQFSRA